jgi:RimJ/RimL family protein N-acetyltransferase
MLNTSTISTARLQLTPLIAADALEMVAVLGDERMHEFTGGAPLSYDDLRVRYEMLVRGQSADGSELWFNWIVRTITADTAVGVVQATVAVDGASADVAWEIGVQWQGMGFASEASAGMVGWLISAGVRTIRACIHPDHVASGRVAAHLGLSPTAELVDGETVWRRILA